MIGNFSRLFRFPHRGFWWLPVIVLMGIGTSAFATLGEPADSVEHDRVQLRAVRKSVSSIRASVSPRSASAVLVHELELAGVPVKEFINGDGRVFAITWSGMSTPDLDLLFGQYASAYTAAFRKRERKPGRAPTTIQTADVRVEHYGQMHNLHGRAYVPRLIPETVDLETIR